MKMTAQIKLKANIQLNVESNDLLLKEDQAKIVLRFEQFLNSISKIELNLEKEKVSVHPRFHLWFTK